MIDLGSKSSRHPDYLANRERWLVTLESGSLPQARLSLHDGTGYCCLGVAEQLRGVRWVDNHGRTCIYAGIIEGYQSEVLTTEGAAWLGLSVTSPYVAYWTGTNWWKTVSLASLNDEFELSFADIARVIRAQEHDWHGAFDQAEDLMVRRNLQERMK